jgi:hypothetical protein
MSRWWKRLERWFWLLFLLSPFIGGAAFFAYLVMSVRSSGNR